MEGLIIINGGNPLKDTPKNWDDAEKWILNANNENEEHNHPVWSFDCGFKLDYDGAIISVSSRFYPPTSHGGSTWDGNCSIYILNKKYKTKSFDCETLEELKTEVEDYVSSIKNEIEEKLRLI